MGIANFGELYSAASPEAREIVRRILALDIEMLDSMVACGNKAWGADTRSGGGRTPGDPVVATMAHDFQRSLRATHLQYRAGYEWLLKKYTGLLAAREDRRGNW